MTADVDNLPATTDVPAALKDQMDMARALAAADILPSHLRRKPADVFAVMQAAVALNLPAWTAVQELYLVNGRISYSACLMRALIIRAGHRIVSIEDDGTAATITAHRRGAAEPCAATFSTDDAATADLLGKDNWQKYPRAMRVARATAILARDYFPDVTAGIAAYMPDELGAEPATADLSE